MGGSTAGYARYSVLDLRGGVYISSVKTKHTLLWRHEGIFSCLLYVIVNLSWNIDAYPVNPYS